MNRNFKYFTFVWAICLALFNAVVFLVPTEYTEGFWTGYVFITLAFLGQLCCAYIALKADNSEKLFYNIPLVSISYTGLLIMLAVGGGCMIIPGLSGWLGVILFLLVLGFTAIAVISAGRAAQIVDSVDEKVTAQSSFVKYLTVDAENLMHQAKANMLKNQCRRVYEALRYSDPMSNDALASIERQIKLEFGALTDAVLAENLDDTESAVSEILTLLTERNNKCRSLK